MMFPQCLYNCSSLANVGSRFIEDVSHSLNLHDYGEYSAMHDIIFYVGFKEDLEYEGFDEIFE